MEKRVVFLILLMMNNILYCLSQEFDLVVSSTDTGIKTYQARNSITFANNYSYTPNGGSLTTEFINPVFEGIVTYTTTTDPETRTLNTSSSCKPGTTGGVFSVNSTGNSTYTIPIEVLPGIAGLQPTLALQYNSFEGSGIAGQGWNLNGISVITRSPQTHYYDGNYTGVDLSSTDRFSLDGQRLICVSGTYGENASVYRTENDQFSKITCFAGSNGPEQFEVKTKNGLTLQYGYNDDADQIVDGHVAVISWNLNRITDVYGNTIDFTYTRDEGLNYIGEIKYGPNVITFHYKLRSDKNTLFIKGKPMKQQLIADHINISYNSVLVRKYQFKYNYLNSVYNGYSVLNEVTEYGTDNFWYNSTAFTYQKPDTVAFSRTTGNSTHSVITYKSDLYPGDFNGDAKNDFLCLPNANASWTGYKIYHGDGNGNFTLAHQSTTFSFGTPEDVRILDLNGDGKDDIICEIADSGTSTFKYILNSGSVFSYSVIYL